MERKVIRIPNGDGSVTEIPIWGYSESDGISVVGNNNVVASGHNAVANGGTVIMSPRQPQPGTHAPAADTTPVPADETVGKSTLTRAGVWFLFRELRRKGVINQMSDTELSIAVGAMTGYSAEKLRQGGLLTDKARDALTDFLQGLIDETEG